MSHEIKIYLGNCADKDALVSIGADTYIVSAKDCPYVVRESGEDPFLVKIGFFTDEPKASDSKEFTFELASVIRFCEYNGELRFCEIKRLEPTATLKLAE